MNTFYEKLIPGIRAKLSFFTAFFVTVIISIISLLYMRQQYQALTEGFDREVQPLRKYTEKIVLDLENITNSFILIEEFRYRLMNKSIELKQFQKVSVDVIENIVQEKSTFEKNIPEQLKFLQIEKYLEYNSFIKEKVVNKFDFFQKKTSTTENEVINIEDTYYSEYITERKIRQIEENIRSLMLDEKGNVISLEKFEKLKLIAHQILENSRKLESIENKILNELSLKIIKNENGEEIIDPKILQKNIEIDKKISTLSNELNSLKNNIKLYKESLNSEILLYFYLYIKNNIQEIGLNSGLIFIQSFSDADSKPSFDTRIFSDTNILNSSYILNHPKLQNDWQARIKTLKVKDLLNYSVTPIDINIEGKEYEIFFQPILKKPSVVQRSKKIIEMQKDKNQFLNDFIEKDKVLCSEFQVLSGKIKKRFAVLRSLKSGKPSNDLEFVNLYNDYKKLLQKRQYIYLEYTSNLNLKVKNLEEYETKIQEDKISIASLETQIQEKKVLQLKINLEEEKIQIESEIFQKELNLEDLKNEVNRMEQKKLNWSDSIQLMESDAIQNLREAALFEYSILRYKYNANAYNEYLSSQRTRAIEIEKWKSVRTWVMSANSEILVPDIKYNSEEIPTFEAGVLSRSRSEVEEEMWRLDSTPLMNFSKTTEFIFFSDIRGFTSISEKLEPEQVVEFLNEYMTLMVDCVNKTNGIVDKFIGDAIMATWGAALSKGNDAENAINASLLMRKFLIEFNLSRGTNEKPLILIGCGLNFGPVIAGQIGSEDRLEYTVIGDAVNLASRVESLNKAMGTDILITEDMYIRVPDIFDVVKMQKIKVKGKSEPQTIYAVLGHKSDPNRPKNLEELRMKVGIVYNENRTASVDEKEEKFEILPD